MATHAAFDNCENTGQGMENVGRKRKLSSCVHSNNIHEHVEVLLHQHSISGKNIAVFGSGELDGMKRWRALEVKKGIGLLCESSFGRIS